MPKRLAAIGAAVVLAVAGCSDSGDESATLVTPVPSVSAADQLAEQPAASAGGACILWDYAFIEETIGIRFAVAASDQIDDTSTCVVQTTTAAWPDLSLSVVETTSANADVFLDTRMPAKATKLTGLGRAAYRLNTKASAEHGPTVEIGWLSEAKQLQTVRFTFAKGASAADVKSMNTKLLSLAKGLSTTNG
ncbi:hypothetical protein AB0G04_16190 [Actinoplanes sp. NPDC023801]|uniref:hypothetical protein n=1 Tax=Actinoplanes sp. NPDC023801 TaxID=3154595 RepID=UPI00340A75AD